MRQYDLDNPTETQPDATSYPWYAVWIEVITQPNQATFQRLLHDPKATAQRAYLWVFLAGGLLGIPQMAYAELPYELDALTVVLMGPIMGAFGSLILFIIQTWFLQRVAVLMGGKGRYGDLHYARGTFVPALLIAQTLLLGLFGTWVLAVQLVLLAALFVEMSLTVVALQAVNRMHNSQAIFVTGAVYIGIFLSQTLLVFSII